MVLMLGSTGQSISKPKKYMDEVRTSSRAAWPQQTCGAAGACCPRPRAPRRSARCPPPSPGCQMSRSAARTGGWSGCPVCCTVNGSSVSRHQLSVWSCGQFSFSSPFLKPLELQQTELCRTPLTRTLVLFVLWFKRIIIKVFVKHKILSIETILSIHTHTQSMHTCMRTHTHTHFLTDRITASYTYGQMSKFGPQVKMQKCLKTQNKKIFPSAGFLRLLYLHLNIKNLFISELLRVESYQLALHQWRAGKGWPLI